MSEDISPSIVYCANHPGVETGLRCKRCNKPICAKCAISTPTGYICKECENLHEKSFDTATSRDYIIAGILALVISGLGSFVGSFLGFFVLLAAPIAGVAIAEAVRGAVQRRRSKRLFQVVAVATALGGLPMLLIALVSFNLFGMALQGFYLVTAITTAYQRLKGISIR